MELPRKSALAPRIKVRDIEKSLEFYTKSLGFMTLDRLTRRNGTIIYASIDALHHRHDIEILHHDADPCVWIVRHSRKIFWFKNRISSDWCVSRQQAFAYAIQLNQQYSKENVFK